MCLTKLPTPFELGYSSFVQDPTEPNPFEVGSESWRHWNFGYAAADEERAREDDERERENYFAWSNWE